MKITNLIAAAVLLISISSAEADENAKNSHFIFRYNTGDIYEIELGDAAITWRGLEGSDVGKNETDAIKRQILSKDVEVIQWTETNGIFVTLVFDHLNMKMVSSGKTENDAWLTYGTAEEINK
jgi:phenolic acid decarboxylase